MGREHLLNLAALCALASGCGLFENATRNLVVEPLHYHEELNRCWACLKSRGTANAAWEEYSGQSHPGSYSDDFVRGFKQGFSDYLQAGGTAGPPPIPPRKYWSVSYQTPEGHQAIEQWFGGYSQGATMAQEKDYRRWITLPSSLAPPAENVDAQSADLLVPNALPEKPAADPMPDTDPP